mmetsp:Transcript_26223/g.53172  ORF Transcript_26223/g.53172 Transcript_26223/m.53172 type:complete len:280 (-) Transcript_26223:137-976(-)
MKQTPSLHLLQSLTCCWLASNIIFSVDSFSYAPNPFRIQSQYPAIHTHSTTPTTPTITHQSLSTTTTALYMAYNKYGNGRSSPRTAAHQPTRTKRQERVGHVVRTELATILHQGHAIKYDDDPIEDELRRKINIVHVDVSPDLRQARVTVSIMGTGGVTNGDRRKEDMVDKRRAYAWLVRCTKSIRHALAQRMKHMKASPELVFVQVDVGAAVDVMQLIEKVSKGYKRDDVLEMEFEDEEGDDEDDWVDEDEEGEIEEDDDDDWEDFDFEDGMYVDVEV